MVLAANFGIVHKKACFLYPEAGFKIISD